MCLASRALLLEIILISFLKRFLFFFWQVTRSVLIAALIFAACGLVGYTLVQTYISGEEVLVPNITGRQIDEAARMLAESQSDLAIRIEDFAYDDSEERGEILAQFPLPENYVKAGTVIQVTVSSGTTLLQCPDVRGMNYVEGGVELRRARLREGQKAYIHTPYVEKDLVVAQDPPAHSFLRRDGTVSLLISLGPEVRKKRMPSLAGLTPTEANTLLEKIGLSALSESNTRRTSEAENNTIFEQWPLPGTPVEPDVSIRVQVAENQSFF